MRTTLFVVVESSQWPAAVVAVAILVIIGILMTVALVRHKFEDSLKLWGAMGSLLGVITGMAGTYFFTRDQIVQAERQADRAEERVGQLNTEVVSLAATNQELTEQVAVTSTELREMTANYAELQRAIDAIQMDFSEAIRVPNRLNDERLRGFLNDLDRLDEFQLNRVSP